MELVSVVITTYMRPIEILFRAVRSVINQDYENIELLVVNDAPENQSLAQTIIKEINIIADPRIRYFSCERNSGSNFARNLGLNNSRGKYIAFLDDDDEWFPQKLSEQVKVITEDENLAMISCGFKIIRSNGIIQEKKPYPQDHRYLTCLLRSNYIGSTSFPLLNRQYVLDVGGFDVSFMACQDYDLWIRLREKHPFAAVDKPLGNYYVSRDSVFRQNRDRIHYGHQLILKKYHDLYVNDKKAYYIHLNNMSYIFLAARKPAYYWQYKLKAIKGKPFSLYNFSLYTALKLH